MSYNGSKFQLIRLGRNEDLKQDTSLFSEKMKEVILPADWVHDLGVAIEADATFSTQRSQALIKARRKAGWVMRTFYTRDRKTMITLWKSLIQPHLDYCGQLWQPANLTGEIQDLEQVLRSFSRRVQGMRNLSYWERLRDLRLLSIQR